MWLFIIFLLVISAFHWQIFFGLAVLLGTYLLVIKEHRFTPGNCVIYLVEEERPYETICYHGFTFGYDKREFNAVFDSLGRNPNITVLWTQRVRDVGVAKKFEAWANIVRPSPFIDTTNNTAYNFIARAKRMKFKDL